MTSLTSRIIDTHMRAYSIYEAKARFSELIRRVREGESIVVTYRGEPVAEIQPLASGGPGLEDRIRQLAGRGELLIPEESGSTGLRPLVRRPGALERFLEERDA